jgi:hypothetical protein
MYDVMVYDERLGQFIPVKNEHGKAYSYESWNDAAEHVYALNESSNGNIYKTEYRTTKARKRNGR